MIDPAPGKHHRLHSIQRNASRASRHDDDLLFVVLLARFQCLEDFAQILERLLILGTHRLLILTAWIGPLQRGGHGSRYRDRIASMALFADEIELRCARSQAPPPSLVPSRGA